MVSLTLPFFALVFLGYLAARLRWVPTEAVPAFNGFLLFFAVPAMLYRFASNTPFEQLVNARFMLAWTLCGVVLLLVVASLARRLFAASQRDASFFGLSAAVGNVGFMGVPMMVALLGEGAAAVPILAIVVDAVVVGSVGLILAEAGGATRKGWRADLKDGATRIFLNPFVIAMILGALASSRGFELPTAMASIVKLLADAAGPCALMKNFSGNVHLPAAFLRRTCSVVSALGSDGAAARTRSGPQTRIARFSPSARPIPCRIA